MSSLHISLPRDVSSPAAARHELCSFGNRHNLGDMPTVLLATSELVTNAVMYGTGPIDVSVSCDAGIVRVEVSDNDPDAAQVQPTSTNTPDRPDGRGLQIVDTLARRWGTMTGPTGKTVWAEFADLAPERGSGAHLRA